MSNIALKNAHGEYINRLIRNGHAVTQYCCPTCDETIDTKEAPHGEEWDSVATCYECGELHIKYTSGGCAWGMPI